MEEETRHKGREEFNKSSTWDWLDTRAVLVSIVNSSDDAIIGKTLDGIIMSWNAGAERIYGYSAQEVKGRSVSILIPKEYAGELADILRKVKRGQRVHHYETVRIRKDGKKIHVSLTASPIKDRRGKIIGTSTIAKDISERKEMERGLQEKMNELEAFYRIAVGHEREKVELRKEVNKLSKELGRDEPYDE